MRSRILLTLIWLLALLPALAKDEIIPTPPDFVLDKQLPGSDPYWIERPTFSPDGKVVAGFFNGSKMLTVWDVASGQVLKEIGPDVHQLDSIDGLEFSHDGTHLILLRNIQPLRWLDWKNGKVTRELAIAADPKKILDYSFSPDQSLLVVATYKGIHLWDLKASKKLKSFVPEVPVCSVDWLEYTPPKQPKVRLLAYAKPLMGADTKWKDVAGIINIDSGKVTPLLNDVPADKKVEGKMTFFRVRWEWGGEYLLVCYWNLPPASKAGVMLVDSVTGKYSANHELEQLAVGWEPRYLGKPFWGFEVLTWDITGNPYKTAAQFLVPTRKEGLKIVDTVNETVLPMQSMSINRTRTMAAITTKKDPMSPSELFLYKLVPKK